MKRGFFLPFILISFLSACSSPQVYKDVFNTDSGPNVRTFNASVDTCYLAVSRGILSQNFRIEKEDTQSKLIQAARYFQDGKETIILTITVSVKPAGDGKATIYASAVQTLEKLHKKTERFLFIPIGSEARKVKEEEKTVEDEEFYKKFFEAVEKEIKILATK